MNVLEGLGLAASTSYNSSPSGKGTMFKEYSNKPSVHSRIAHIRKLDTEIHNNTRINRDTSKNTVHGKHKDTHTPVSYTHLTLPTTSRV